MKLQADNPLPRELAPGVHWLGQCTSLTYQGQTLHSYQSAYLVIGEECSALVEMGLTSDAPVIQAQLDELLADAPPLRYLFISHHETPHAGGIGRWLDRYPDAIACGNVMDLHLVLPEFADRLRPLEPGAEVDLGGSRLQVVEAVFRDMPYTRWAFDTKRRVLFTSDGFAFSHVHGKDHCGLLGEEVAASLDIEEMTALFAFAAFHWTQLVDIEPYIERLEALLAELDVALVAPTHGLPFADFDAVMPEILKGLRLGSEREAQSLLDLAEHTR
jgi:flavorubredoxin